MRRRPALLGRATRHQFPIHLRASPAAHYSDNCYCSRCATGNCRHCSGGGNAISGQTRVACCRFHLGKHVERRVCSCQLDSSALERSSSCCASGRLAFSRQRVLQRLSAADATGNRDVTSGELCNTPHRFAYSVLCFERVCNQHVCSANASAINSGPSQSQSNAVRIIGVAPAANRTPAAALAAALKDASRFSSSSFSSASTASYGEKDELVDDLCSTLSDTFPPPRSLSPQEDSQRAALRSAFDELDASARGRTALDSSATCTPLKMTNGCVGMSMS